MTFPNSPVFPGLIRWLTCVQRKPVIALSTLHWCKISARFHSLTEMSGDRNGQTKTARPNRCGVVGQHHESPYFHPRHRPHPPGMALPRRAWVRLNRLRTGVGLSRSCLPKWDMVPSAACECGAEEQTFEYVVLECPIHRPPHGLHSLTVMNDETIEWLLNACPEI